MAAPMECSEMTQDSKSFQQIRENSGSLFPAYASTTASTSTNQPTDWLQNSSFNIKDAETLHQIHLDRVKTTQSTSKEIKDDAIPSNSASPQRHRHKRRHTPDSDESSSSDSEGHSYHRHKHKKKSKKSKKSKHKHHKHHKDRDRDRQSHDDKKKTHKHSKEDASKKEKSTSSKPVDKLPEYPAGKVFIEEIPGLTPELAFRMDRKPDMDNIAYGTIYRTHIAKYHRFCNIPLGLTDGQMVFMTDKRKGASKIATNRYFGKESRPSKTDSVQDLSKPVINRLSQKYKNENLKQKGFIPITDEKNDSSVQKSGEDTSPSGEEMNMKESEHETIKTKVAELNRQLGENPGDVHTWLELVEFQTKAVEISEDYQKTEVIYNRDSIIQDIQASVLEKALEKNPASLELKIHQLQLCAKDWEMSKLSKEWKRLTFLHPNHPQVWWHYLKFLTTNIRSFSVSALLKAAGKCMKVLQDVRAGTMLTHPPPPHLQDHMIEIFLEVCNILWHCGHTEKACALYQAMLELNLFAPSILQEAPLTDQLDFLEAFWDSSFPRVGEDDALGWGRWVETKAEVPFSSMYSKEKEEADEEEILNRKESQWHTWTALEKHRSSQLWLPWRTDVRGAVNQDECEDPERVVIFEDVKECLFRLSPDACLPIILAFLKTLGVTIQDNWPSLGHVFIHRLKSNVRFSQIFSHFPDATGPQDSEISQTLSDKVVGNLLDQMIPKMSGYSRTLLTVLRLQWKYDQLPTLEDTNAKAWKTACKEFKKFAKSQLKLEENRNSLLVWEAYAVLEWKFNNLDDARRVLDTALTMNSIPVQRLTDFVEQCTLCRIYQTYIELEMGLGRDKRTATSPSMDRQRCLHLLVSLANSEPFQAFTGDVAPPLILKARRSYQQFLEEILHQQDKMIAKCSEQHIKQIRWIGSTLLHWTVCYAIFQYLTVNIQAANAVFQQTLSADSLLKLQKTVENQHLLYIVEEDPYSEITLHQLKLVEDLTFHQMSLIEYHIKHQVAPLSSLRIPLQRALSHLPDEARLLQAYVSMEGRGNIVGQLRRHLLTVSQHSRTPLVWLYTVVAELQRISMLEKHYKQMLESDLHVTGMCGANPWESGVRYQLRAWFERALSQSTGAHCLLLWRLYLYCEVQQKQLVHAKAIYYRAAQQCPWAKALYMDAIQYFPELLQEVTDLMVEKEIRLRTPLEELSLLMDSVRDGDDDEHGEDGDALPGNRMEDNSDQPQSTDVLPGNSSDHSQSKDVLPGNSSDHPQSKDVLPGNSSDHPQSKDVLPGNSSDHSQSKDVLPGNSSDHPQSKDVLPGNSSDHPQSKDVLPGNSSDHPQSEDVLPGSSCDVDKTETVTVPIMNC